MHYTQPNPQLASQSIIITKGIFYAVAREFHLCSLFAIFIVRTVMTGYHTASPKLMWYSESSASSCVKILVMSPIAMLLDTGSRPSSTTTGWTVVASTLSGFEAEMIGRGVTNRDVCDSVRSTIIAVGLSTTALPAPVPWSRDSELKETENISSSSFKLSIVDVELLRLLAAAVAATVTWGFVCTIDRLAYSEFWVNTRQTLVMTSREITIAI